MSHLQWCLLLVMCTVLLHSMSAAAARNPTFPGRLTGRPGCLQPIRSMRCVRDIRSSFVAGISTSYGYAFGYHHVCNDGGVNTYIGLPGQAQAYDMSDPTADAFPKLPDGQPDLRYYYPYASAITQMIVLQAPNPYGDKFGRIPAIIFAYINVNNVTNATSLEFAVCGDATYAYGYLFPGEAKPPITPVHLQASYVNPMSMEDPQRYLGSFQGHCGILGRGYLGGDPNTLSKNALKSTSEACFAPYPNPDFIPFPGPKPKTPVEPGVKMDLPPYRPCYYNKHNSKPGHGGTSFSCVANGYTVATGKYGLINLDGQGMRVGWARDDKMGELKQVNNPELFEGTEQGAMLSAPAPAPSRA